MKPDIQNIEDIKILVNCFYDKVNADAILSHVFNDFAKVEWDSHLPKMYNFWNTLILGKPSYKGNPFEMHKTLPLKKEHFEKWLFLFEQTVDEHFSGLRAETAKNKAKSIAFVFQTKLLY